MSQLIRLISLFDEIVNDIEKTQDRLIVEEDFAERYIISVRLSVLVDLLFDVSSLMIEEVKLTGSERQMNYF